MKNFKIITDRAMLSDKQILSKKPRFDNILSKLNISKPPFYKSPWFLSGTSSVIVIAATIISIIYFNNNSTNKTTDDNETSAISVNTQVNKNDNPVNSSIENNNPTSNQIDAKVIFEENNAVSENITNETSDNIIKTENIENISTVNTLLKPRLAEKNKYIFKVNVDLKEFPELKEYKNLIYEVDDSKKKFDPKLYDVKWSSAKLKKSKMKDNYILILSKSDTTIKIFVLPVFDKKDYDIALKKYNSLISQKK